MVRDLYRHFPKMSSIWMPDYGSSGCAYIRVPGSHAEHSPFIDITAARVVLSRCILILNMSQIHPFRSQRSRLHTPLSPVSGDTFLVLSRFMTQRHGACHNRNDWDYSGRKSQFHSFLWRRVDRRQPSGPAFLALPSNGYTVTSTTNSWMRLGGVWHITGQPRSPSCWRCYLQSETNNFNYVSSSYDGLVLRSKASEPSRHGAINWSPSTRTWAPSWYFVAPGTW